MVFGLILIRPKALRSFLGHGKGCERVLRLALSGRRHSRSDADGCMLLRARVPKPTNCPAAHSPSLCSVPTPTRFKQRTTSREVISCDLEFFWPLRVSCRLPSPLSLPT